MSDRTKTFHYHTLREWSTNYYKGLLKKEDVNDAITVLDERYILITQGINRYLLSLHAIEELPLLPTNTKYIDYRGKPYQIVTSYKSARFKSEKHYAFRQMVDDLCPFVHDETKDYVVWKIIAFAALLSKCVYRICSPPAFGKDSVLKVLGYLTGDVCVIANPTVAKLEYRLTNKLLMLNEFANLKAEDRYGMEHFLQSVGDGSNTYEKRSRAGVGTSESTDIGELSLVCAYNDLECYTDDSRFFDRVFTQQTKDRFIPFKFKGTISQQIENVPDPREQAMVDADYLQKYVRSITYYKESWLDEVMEKRNWLVKRAIDYGFKGRWANNFDVLIDFILLYSETPEEASMLMNTLYNRHVDYMEMVYGRSLLTSRKPKLNEELVVSEERIVV